VDANGFQVRLLGRGEAADDVAGIVEDPKLVSNLRSQKSSSGNSSSASACNSSIGMTAPLVSTDVGKTG